jgi:hypothetical protein
MRPVVPERDHIHPPCASRPATTINTTTPLPPLTPSLPAYHHIPSRMRATMPPVIVNEW